MGGAVSEVGKDLGHIFDEGDGDLDVGHGVDLKKD